MSGLLLVELVAKMAVSAAIVVAASMLTERAGPLVGATIASLPWASGPAYVLLAMDHDATFIARSALVSLVVYSPNLLFALTYAAFAKRYGVLASMGTAGAVWLTTTLVLMRFEWTLGWVLALNAGAYIGCSWCARHYRGGRIKAGAAPRRWDLAVRGLAIALLVGTVIVAGRELGPTAAGLASMIPIILISLALVLHSRLGGSASASVMANIFPGMLGFLCWLVTLHLAVVPLGATWGIGLALLVGCFSSLASLQIWRMSAR